MYSPWYVLRATSASVVIALALVAHTPLPAAAQQPPAATNPLPTNTLVIVTRDAATGLPLEGVQAVRVVQGTESRVIGRSGPDGRLIIGAGVLRSHGAPEAALLLQRIGYAPRHLTAAEIASMIARAEGAGIGAELHLTPRPAMLSAIAIQAEERNQLAVGTALAMATTEREAIVERSATSLAESLEAVEGVTTSRVGAWGSKLSVRGLGGERLAFMVDGSRVNRACTFGMDQGLATMDPATVERVELLAGPGSTLYGSGNVGGVVNVVTRNPALDLEDGRVGGEVRAGASSAIPGGNIGGGLWMRRGRLDASLSVDGQHYGDYRTPVARVEGSSFHSGTADLKVGYALTQAQRMAVQLTNYSGRDIGWPSMAGGLIPREDRRVAAADWAWQRGQGIVDAMSARAYVQRLDHHMLMDMVMPMSGGMDGGGMHGAMAGMAAGMTDGMTMRSTTDARSYSTTSGGRAQLRLRPTTSTHVDAGVEAVQWKAEGTRWITTSTSGGMGGDGTPSTSTYHSWPNVRILDLGVFAQGEHQLTDRATVSAGARADHITKRAHDWSPASQTLATGNVGARIALDHGFAVRSSVGLGYRVPDPTELFGIVARPDGYVYRGNPDLRTERGRTVEAGVTWNGALHALMIHDAELSVTAFRNDLSGLISPALATSDSVGGLPVREYVNIQDARITGLTSAATLHIAPALRLRGSSTYARGVNLQGNTSLAAVAPLTGSVALRFAPDATAGILPAIVARRGWLEVEGRAAARQDRIAAGAGEMITPGWGSVAIRGGLDVAGASLAVSVDNILDRTFREHLDPAGLLRPGRNFSIRVTRAF